MGIGASRNSACTCGSGQKYKDCHLPKISGFLPDGQGGWVHKDTFSTEKELLLVLKKIKKAVPEARQIILKTVFLHIVMPRKFWDEEPKKWGLFNFTEEQLNKAQMFKSGFIGACFGLECFITNYDGTDTKN